MPMELLVGVLLVSVIVNLALLLWFARADHVKIHWPPRLQSAADRLPPPSTRNGAPSTRPRSSDLPDHHDGNGQIGFAALSAQLLSVARAPLSETLPRELAEFLAIPAAVAPHAEGFDISPSANGADTFTSAVENADGHRPTERAGLPTTGPGAPSGGLSLDPLTGLESAASWSRIIAIENARLMRHRRPVTVVVAEVEGLRRLTERFGDEPADRLLPVIASTLRRQARSTDWVARVGTGRFAAFLPETDEVQATNYVERIRLVCEPWLSSSAVPLRLAIGWSSPAASSDLEFALERAEERMHLDRRMPSRSVQQSAIAPARVVSPPQTGVAQAGRLVEDEDEDEDEAGVPPAETGRSNGLAPREIQPESATGAQSEGLLSDKSARAGVGPTQGRTRRTKDEPPGGPAKGPSGGQ